jgi:hypothetical protein
MQEQFGYPALTIADKDRILSTNAQEIYDVTDDALRTADRERDRAWVTNASSALTAAVASAR